MKGFGCALLIVVGIVLFTGPGLGFAFATAEGWIGLALVMGTVAMAFWVASEIG